MTKSKKPTEKTAKPSVDLETFIENVNKKDKLNGRRIHFGFTKRVR